ncbi:MAG: hypothetical protein H6714_02380 [Myxococcales bacterium]|nr:hypothetical protein [Myxococcales bacterium]
MAAALPYVLMALAVVAVFTAITMVGCSFKGLLGGAGQKSPIPVSQDRARLLEQKHALLMSLKDIAFEQDLGKLSQEDYGSLEREYRRKALVVLQALDDDIEPFRRQAEALLQSETPKGGEK